MVQASDRSAYASQNISIFRPGIVRQLLPSKKQKRPGRYCAKTLENEDRQHLMKIPSEVTEHAIQQSIIEWLQYKNWFVWRHNSGMVQTIHNTMVRMGVAGMPDVFALKDGLLIGVEVKRPGKKATELQEQMLKELENHGGRTIIAHSVEEVEQWIKLLELK